MKKQFILAFLCAMKLVCTAQATLVTQDYKRDLLAMIALFICENENKFNDAQLLAVAKKHKGEKDIKTLFLKLLTNENDPAIAKEMLADVQYQATEDAFFKAIGKKKNSIKALGDQLTEFSNEFVVVFLKMQLDGKKFTPETFADLKQIMETLEKEIENNNQIVVAA